MSPTSPGVWWTACCWFYHATRRNTSARSPAGIFLSFSSIIREPARTARRWARRIATEYLIKLGHSRIGFITGWMDLGCSMDRLEGYRSALRTYHASDAPELIYEGTFFQPAGYAGASALLDLPNPPTAIFASNDIMAMGAMDAVRSRGLRIPNDISIVGFDDIPQAAVVRPALTTVSQPLEKMGRVATQMLLDLLRQPDKKVDRIELPTELVIRESCQSMQRTE
jgi:LacI family transcriptional regulator